MLAALGFICGPMAVEQRSVDARFDFAFSLGIDPILITSVVGATLGVEAGLKN
jgi:hypothetical protein